MADAAEVAIEAALLAQAQAFAAAQSLTIAMPNVDFTPPTVSKTAKYLRATFLPADTEAMSLGADDANKLYGFLQLDVFHGQGAGELVPARIAASAISSFKRGTRLTRDGFTIDIIKQPYRGPSIKDDPWLMIPVRIPYQCFANPA